MILKPFASSIVLLQAIVLIHGTHLSDLQKLCRDGKARLNTITDLRNLVAALNDVLPTQTSACSNHVAAALNEMGRIAADPNACTTEKAQDLANFVATYLRTDPTDEHQVGESMPKPLVKFAIAYGMQVSNICMKRMIYVFSYKAYYKLLSLNSEEFELVRKIAHKNSPIDRMLAPIVKNGEIVLPSDLFDALPGLAKRVSLYLNKRDPLKQIEEICTKKLQPFYEPILMPIATLTRLGFTYRDFWLRKDDFLNGKVLNKRGRFWSNVVFLCESIKNFALVEQNSDPDHESIDIELEASKAESGRAELMAGALATNEPNDQDEGELADEQQHFPGDFSIPDEIVGNKIMPGQFDYSLKSMVYSFDLNQDAVQRIQTRILNRSLSIFKSLLKLGQYKPLLKKMIKNLNFRKGPDDTELDEAFQEARESLLTLIEVNEDAKPNVLIHAAEFVAKLGLIPFKVTLELLRFVTSYTITLMFIKSFMGPDKETAYRNKFEHVY